MSGLLYSRGSRDQLDYWSQSQLAADRNHFKRTQREDSTISVSIRYIIFEEKETLSQCWETPTKPRSCPVLRQPVAPTYLNGSDAPKETTPERDAYDFHIMKVPEGPFCITLAKGVTDTKSVSNRCSLPFSNMFVESWISGQVPAWQSPSVPCCRSCCVWGQKLHLY